MFHTTRFFTGLRICKVVAKWNAKRKRYKAVLPKGPSRIHNVIGGALHDVVARLERSGTEVLNVKLQ